MRRPPNAMNDPAKQKPFPKAVLIILILSVVALAILFATLATIGDDVPSGPEAAAQSETQ
jgi:hypothetical protein